ncbi:MAG: hypothetical protein RL562_2046 [Planctomycetota bacterium]|jgi:hypothetical protein
MSNSSSRPILAGLLVALLAGTAVTQQFTITQSAGNDTFGGRSRGQTFTPGIGVTPALGAQTALPLTRITLYRGNAAPAASSATTYLNIYDADPNAGGNFVGSSLQSVDTRSLTFRTPMVWDFDQIPLLVSVEYWAVMSSTNTPGNLDVEVSLETEPRNGPPGPNIYTGGTGLIANMAPHPNSVDAKFQMEFFDGPLAVFRVSGSGCSGAGAEPTLSAAAPPRFGQTLQIDVGSLVPGSASFVFLGLSDTSWNGPALPVPVSLFFPSANPSCQILVSPDLPLPGVRTGSVSTSSLPIPTTPSLGGAQFYFQAWQFEPTTVSVSAKALARIGN